MRKYLILYSVRTLFIDNLSSLPHSCHAYRSRCNTSMLPFMDWPYPGGVAGHHLVSTSPLNSHSGATSHGNLFAAALARPGCCNRPPAAAAPVPSAVCY
jgi:hypothetical protein